MNDDPVPPAILDKALFTDGEWWMQRTVIEAPFQAGFTFVGDGDLADRVRWSIEENLIVARRVIPIVRGVGDTAGLNDYSAPVAAYPIVRHLDVWNGQLVEAPKKPWYERGYLEVDWGNEVSGSYRFSLGRLDRTSASYYVSNPSDPDGPIFGPDYIDFTTHALVRPSEGVDPEEGYGSSFCKTAIEGFVDAIDCSALDITYRTSFLKVPPDHSYEPKQWSPTDEYIPVRYFNVGELGYSAQEGLTEKDLAIKVSRFRIFERAADENGDPISYRDRAVRAIPIYLNAEFPRELVGEAQFALDEWSAALESTVVELRKWECIDAGGSEEICTNGVSSSKVLVLCPNNPVVEGDPAACGAPGTIARLGDMRYSMLRWETAPSVLDLVGIGWWSPDITSGETVSAHAHVWGAYVDRAAALTRDAVLLLQGRLQLEEHIHGPDIEALADALEAYRLRGTQDNFVPRVAPVLAGSVAEVEQGPSLAQRWPRFRSEVMAPVLDTPFESMVLEPESFLVRGLSPEVGSSEQDVLARVSALRRPYSEAETWRADLAARLARIGGDVDLPLEPNLGELIAELSTVSPEEIYLELRRRLTRAVVIHELGHVLGLRHNFSGSFDSLNYQDEYWSLREDGQTGPRYLDPVTREELALNIESYGYASVMDYHASANAYRHGLGHYDKAAVARSYGGLVEVFDDVGPRLASDENLRLLYRSALLRTVEAPQPLYAVTDPQAPRGHRHRSLHYSRWRATFGDLSKRSFVPERHLGDAYGMGVNTTDDRGRPVVPYLTCDDDLAGQLPFCFRFDQGADAYEVVTNFESWFRNYYYFNSYRRGRLSFGADAYARRMWDRVFGPIKLWQNFFAQYIWEIGPEDPAFLSDPDGLGAIGAGVDRSFVFLAQLLATPSPGDFRMGTRPDGTAMLATDFEPVVHFRPDPRGGIAVNIPSGQGRQYRTTFHARRRPLIDVMGSAVDKELAMTALVDPSFYNFPGRETWEDTGLWMVNFSNTHGDVLIDLIGAICADDLARFAPHYNGVHVHFRDFLDPASTIDGTPVDPAIGLNFRLRMLVYGLAFVFRGSSDASFKELVRVSIDDGLIPPGTWQYATFASPFSGVVYRARRFDGTGRELGIGARMLDAAQRLETARTTATTDDDRIRAEDALRDQLDLIEIARELVQAFDETPFAGPLNGG